MRSPQVRARGRCTRTRWSLEGLSNWVCTRRTGSSARISRVVSTTTVLDPTLVLVDSSTRSGQV